MDSENNTGLRNFLTLPKFYNWLQALLIGNKPGSFYADLFGLVPTTTVLDLGCGTGNLLRYLKDVVPTKYVGIDISEAFIEAARVEFGHLATFHIAGADGFDTVFLEDKFDKAIAMGLLHHIDDNAARATLQYAANNIAVDGQFCSLDPTFTEDMGRIAKTIVGADRGQHVRKPSQYAALAGEYFAKVETIVLDNVLRVPYRHCLIRASSPH